MIFFEQFFENLKADPFFSYEHNLVFCSLENYNYKEILDNFDRNPGN